MNSSPVLRFLKLVVLVLGVICIRLEIKPLFSSRYLSPWMIWLFCFTGVISQSVDVFCPYTPDDNISIRATENGILDLSKEK
jgi:hypothetical protein